MCREISSTAAGEGRFLPIRASEPQRRGRAGFLCVTSRCTSRRGGPRHLLHRESVHAPRGARGKTRCLSRSPPPACAGPRERGGRINPRRSKQRPITTHRTPSPPASRSQSSCRGTYFAGCSRTDISRQRQHTGSARDNRTPSLGHLLARSPGALDTTGGTPFSSAAPRHHHCRERRRARRSRSWQASVYYLEVVVIAIPQWALARAHAMAPQAPRKWHWQRKRTRRYPLDPHLALELMSSPFDCAHKRATQPTAPIPRL